MSKLSLKDKMKRLRPFVTFNHDLRTNLDQTLTRSEKAEITKYYNKLSSAISQKHVVYRPRKPANTSKAKKTSGQTGTKFKAYAIPSPTGAGRVKWKGDNPVIEKDGGNVRTVYPDQRRLAREPENYLNELLDDDKLYIINSKNDWRVAGNKRQVINALQEAMWKYGWAENVYNDFWQDDEEVEGVEYGESEKEQFDIVIIECDFKRKEFKEYVSQRAGEKAAEREKARRAKVRDRSAARRRGKRTYGRKGKGK